MGFFGKLKNIYINMLTQSCKLGKVLGAVYGA